MGDHFTLLMDRLLTESTLMAVIESQNQMKDLATSDNDAQIDFSSLEMETRKCSSTGKIVECRICQDEDEDSNMETPCSCCGSLKYAHRRCVQRWCNEKGDTVCEICHQPYEPGYKAPPPLFQLGSMPMNFRGNWAVARRDLNNHRFIAMVSTDHILHDPEDAESTSRNLFYYRGITFTFMVLLVLRHTLPSITSGRQDFSLTLFFLMIIRISGLILPIYIVVKTAETLWRRHFRQGPTNIPSDTSSDEEAGPPSLQVIRCCIIKACRDGVLRHKANFLYGPGYFIKLLIEKKYALPYRVLDAMVSHFMKFDEDERVMPLIWHQSLLAFVQRSVVFSLSGENCGWSFLFVCEGRLMERLMSS